MHACVRACVCVLFCFKFILVITIPIGISESNLTNLECLDGKLYFHENGQQLPYTSVCSW